MTADRKSNVCLSQAAPWQDYDYDRAVEAAVEGVHAAQRQHLAAQDQHRMLRLIVSGGLPQSFTGQGQAPLRLLGGWNTVVFASGCPTCRLIPGADGC